MPWCPKCKYEYVEGIQVCPDCKCKLVEELPIEEETQEDETSISDFCENNIILDTDSDATDVEEQLNGDEEKESKVERVKYRSKKDAAAENKSAATVLLPFGILGMTALILCAVGVIQLPISGFSLYIMYFVMGILFAAFVITGIEAVAKCKKLGALIPQEMEEIQKMKDYVANQSFVNQDAPLEDETKEEQYLKKIELVKKSLEDNFQDCEEGFIDFFIDNFYQEMDSDEN